MSVSWSPEITVRLCTQKRYFNLYCKYPESAWPILETSAATNGFRWFFAKRTQSLNERYIFKKGCWESFTYLKCGKCGSGVFASNYLNLNSYFASMTLGIYIRKKVLRPHKKTQKFCNVFITQKPFFFGR